MREVREVSAIEANKLASSGFVCGKSAKCQPHSPHSAIQVDKSVSSPAYDERTLAADKIKLRSAGKVR